jgi:hypothetical protein
MPNKRYGVRITSIVLVCAWIVVMWLVTLHSVVGGNCVVPDDRISERRLYIFVHFESSDLTSGLLQS